MANNIDNYLQQISEAIYGEDVRSAIVNAIRDGHNEIVSTTSDLNSAADDARTAANNADSKATLANNAASSITAANTGALARANTAINNANTAATNANSKATLANNAATSANNAASSITAEETGALARANAAIDAITTPSIGALARANAAIDSITAANTGALARAEAAIADATSAATAANSAASAITTPTTGALDRAEAAISAIMDEDTGALDRAEQAILNAQQATEAANIAVYGNDDLYNPGDPEYFIGARQATLDAVQAATNANTAAATVNAAVNGNSDQYEPEDPEYMVGAIPAAEMAIAAANSIDESKTAAEEAALRASQAVQDAETAIQTSTAQTELCRQASSTANSNAERALMAALNIEGLSVNTVTLTSNQQATVEVNTNVAPYSITFGIPKGADGAGFTIKDEPYATYSDMINAHPNPSEGDVYSVGTEPPYDIWRYVNPSVGWINMGPLGVNFTNIQTSDVDSIWNGNTPSGETKYLEAVGLYYLIDQYIKSALSEKENSITKITTGDIDSIWNNTSPSGSTKYLDAQTLSYLITSKIKAELSSLSDNKVSKVYVDALTGREKVLSSNDFTDALLTKLNGIASEATKVTVDSALNTSSTNAIQNGTVATNINALTVENSKVSQDIAPLYSSTKSDYKIGDLCIWNNQLYKCLINFVANESFNSEHWVAETVSNNVKSYVKNSNLHRMTWNVETNGKILFLGNSYGKRGDGDEDISDASYSSVVKWPTRTAEYLGLGAEGTNWFNVCEPSHSLVGVSTGGKFIDDLKTWVNTHGSECPNIGAVVLIAGVNDARSNRQPYVLEALSDLATYIKQTFSNAVLYNGYCGWIYESSKPSSDSHGGGDVRMLVAMDYMNAKQYGWNYLHGIENVFHDKNDMYDRIHPNNDGQKLIGRAVANALLTGSCSSAKASGRIYAENVETAADYYVNDIVSTTVTPTSYISRSVNASGRLEQWITDSIIRSQWASMEFDFFTKSDSTYTAAAMPMTYNHIYTIGKIYPRFTNQIDYGNQILMVRTDTDNRGITGMIARVFIEPRTDAAGYSEIRLQIKGFTDGSQSKNVTRVVRFVADSYKQTIAD